MTSRSFTDLTARKIEFSLHAHALFQIIFLSLYPNTFLIIFKKKISLHNVNSHPYTFSMQQQYSTKNKNICVWKYIFYYSIIFHNMQSNPLFYYGKSNFECSCLLAAYKSGHMAQMNQLERKIYLLWHGIYLFSEI